MINCARAQASHYVAGPDMVSTRTQSYRLRFTTGLTLMWT